MPIWGLVIYISFVWKILQYYGFGQQHKSLRQIKGEVCGHVYMKPTQCHQLLERWQHWMASSVK